MNYFRLNEPKGDIAIEIKNCSFSWKNKGRFDEESENNEELIELEPLVNEENDLNFSKTFQLTNISLEINKGELICVIGEVGSGKSSLLSSILGEMWKNNQINNPNLLNSTSKSTLKIYGSVSYVQQNSWIQNKTIKENI